ncbi:MAG: prolyl oligopeptidase family serine peptidase [Candidatus Heimdallarchaeota archaeon]
MSEQDKITEKKLISVDDLYQMKHITSAVFRSGTNEVYYTINQANKDDNGYRQAIWRSGDKPRQFTQGLPRDGSMKWSPDGKQLAFVSMRSSLKAPKPGEPSDPPKPQIFLIPADGGEAIQLTNMPNGVGNFFEWSKDGKKIIFISKLNKEELAEPTPEEKKELDSDEVILMGAAKKKAEAAKVEPRVITREIYRAGTTYYDDRFGQIHVIDLKTKKVDRWTNNLEDDYYMAYLSNNNKFAFTCRRKPGEGDDTRNWEFIKVNPEGEVEILIDDHYTWGAFFEISEDQKHIVTTIGDKELGSLKQQQLCLYNLKTKERKILAKEIDNGKFGYLWSKDGQYIYFIVNDRSVSALWRVSMVDYVLKKIIQKDRIINGYDLSDDGEWICYLTSYVNDPSRLYRYNNTTKKEELIDEPNKKFLDKRKLGTTTEMWYEGYKNEFKIQGWMLTPPDFDPEKKYPLALNMHGGPHVMWSKHQGIPMFHEFQLLAAEGYVVFYCNPRGSDGYGQAFYQSIEKSWGDRDSLDILKGVDLVVKKGFIDEKRMSVTGGSYAGFMTGWLVGHDDRFASAVTQRGVYALRTFWGTSDARSLIDDEFDTNPLEEDHDEMLWKHSPVAYAKNIKTPLMILHSDLDFRAPIPDAELLYAAIKKANPDLDVEFVRYPGEGHELSRSGQPNRRLDRLRKIIYWFNKYSQPQKYKEQQKKKEKIKKIKEDHYEKMREKIKAVKD